MNGETKGMVKKMLRLEGLCVLIVSLFAYSKYGTGWSIFAWCFLLPDISLIGYLAGPRIGACTYNAAHSYIGAIGSLAASMIFPSIAPTSMALIWLAHIGFDRSLGYGLKYAEGFGYTHLGKIGRTANSMSIVARNSEQASAKQLP